MKVAVFSAKPYDRQFLDAANAGCGHELKYLEARLALETAVLAAGFPTVCVFVNDTVDAACSRSWPRVAPGTWPCARPASTTSTWWPPAAWRSRSRASPRTPPTPWPSTRSP